MRKSIIILMLTFFIISGLPTHILTYQATAAASSSNPLSAPLHSNQDTSQSVSEENSWFMAGANPQRTSWVPEAVNPNASSQFGVEWFRPIEAYIGQHVQLVAARDKIYVSTARGVYALDTVSGNEVWRFDTELPIGHSPSVVEGILYVGGFDKRVYALNADTGALIWTFSGAKGGFSTNPLVVEGKVLLGSRDGFFYALDKDNGNLIWQYPAKGNPPLGPILYSAAYQNGKVFFAANDNYAYALNVTTGALLWKSEKMPGDGYQAWWPVVYGDYVMFSAAMPYTEKGDPGTTSIASVVPKTDPYYTQMHNFQYMFDFVNTLQRDDIFHQGEADGSKLGPQFQAGGSGDTTGLQWSWSRGQTVINASKVTEYLENDGQVRVNRPTNKPWRRWLVVLNATNGQDYTFDSDHDGYAENAPFLFTGTKSGNRYPPLIIPTKNDQGVMNDVIYAQNFDTYTSGGSISRARLTAWQFGTPYLHPVGGNYAIDEPFANSAGGSILYENLCCDRVALWTNLDTGDSGSFWDYNHTLESVKLDWSQMQSWMTSLAPGYDDMWWGSSMWAQYPRLTGNYGTVNGIYHNHGLQNPLIPYKGRLFVHRSNGIIALGPHPVSLRQRRQNETPEQYEINIKNEYPQVVKPLLTINPPDQNINSTLTLTDIQNNLDEQITKMLQKGHLQPGYYNGTRDYSELSNYFENPGDTLFSLVRAYPYVNDNIKPDLEKYIKQHYKMYFENNIYARTGYWRDNPGNYDLNNPTGFGQLQPRGWLSLPPEVTEDMKSHKADTYPGWEWPWGYPQNNFYAMWQFARTFYSNDIVKVKDIYCKAKSKLETTPPSQSTLHEKPWLHNAYIAGYIGFLKLQELAGETNTDATLRTTVQTQLNNLLALRANDFSKDSPWTDANSQPQAYKRTLNIARNFMYLTPELGDYLQQNALSKVKPAIDEYNWVAPYWVATRYEATQGEFANDNLYTHPAMFQAKAYILKEPAEQLLKFIDAPAFETGDIFYIQNLVAILQNPGYGFNLKVLPASFQAIKTGGNATFIIQIEPTGGFIETVSVTSPSSFSDLNINLSSSIVTASASQFTLSLVDTHNPSFSSAVWYTIPLTATGGGLIRTTTVNLLLNGKQVYLPLVAN